MHLRSVKREGKDFYEDEHLAGSTDLVMVIKAIIDEERKRKAAGCKILEIPIRPDHGHQMIDDLRKKTNPGYSCIGRLKGLAEIKGIAAAIEKTLLALFPFDLVSNEIITLKNFFNCERQRLGLRSRQQFGKK